MDRPTLYITRLLPQPVMDAIPRHYHILTEPADRPPTAEELRRRFTEADAVICTLTDRIDASLLSHATRLKIIANYAVGYNNIDVPAATQCGITITNTPDVLTDATADLIVGGITGAGTAYRERRHLDPNRQVAWVDANPTVGRRCLWQNAGHRWHGAHWPGCRATSVRISNVGDLCRPSPRSQLHQASPGTGNPLDTVLEKSDFLSLHVPLTDTTHHLIGRRELTLMKPTAYLINTSRGPVIDEVALVSALEAQTIAGAGLDVYEYEPMVSTGLIALPNVVLLPHLGSATLETRVRMGLICLDNIAAVLGGRPGAESSELSCD